MIRFLPVLPVLLVFPWLASCLEFREEVRVANDGSARVSLGCSLPTRALVAFGGPDGVRERIETMFADLDGLELDRLDIEENRGETRLRIEASAPSMLDLLDLREADTVSELPPSAIHLLGETDVRLDGLSLDVRRQPDFRRALGFAALGIGSRDRETKCITHVVHLPAATSSHNATRTENGGHTLIWEHTLGQALAGPLELEFRAPLPVPRWLPAAAGLLGLALVAGILLLLKRRRTRRSRRRAVAPRTRRRTPEPTLSTAASPRRIRRIRRMPAPCRTSTK